VAKLHLDHTPRWPPEITPNEPVKLHHVLGHYLSADGRSGQFFPFMVEKEHSCFVVGAQPSI
ncbi:hypothetical protein, partial [Paracoccus salsus]|uniref:hypothetical protein n=1 Tax=Paracoccus salsus TaxID=2911061 RepID=UPI001F20E91A